MALPVDRHRELQTVVTAEKDIFTDRMGRLGAASAWEAYCQGMIDEWQSANIIVSSSFLQLISLIHRTKPVDVAPSSRLRLSYQPPDLFSPYRTSTTPPAVPYCSPFSPALPQSRILHFTHTYIETSSPTNTSASFNSPLTSPITASWTTFSYAFP